MNNEIKAIFLDFDWTLFDHKTRSFNEKGIQGLKKAQENGVKLIINSARSYYSLKGLGTFDKLHFDGFVVSNGGATYFQNKILYSDTFKEDVKNEFINFLNKNNFGYILICEFDSFIKVVDKKLTDDFYSVFYEPFPLDIKNYKNEKVLSVQVLTTPDNDELLRSFTDKYNMRFDRFAENNVEISSIDFLKSKGIETMFKHLNLNKENAMAFGDDLNDISMFKKVKYGICLGNGKEEAKKEAYYVTDNIEDDGLYNALKHFEVI